MGGTGSGRKPTWIVEREAVLLILRHGLASPGELVKFAGRERTIVHHWPLDAGLDWPRLRDRELAKLWRRALREAEMSGRNFDKLRAGKAMRKYGAETINGGMESAALARLSAPPKVRVAKSVQHAKAKDATAEFIAKGGKIRRIPPRR